jgi:hypothetical protein
MILDINVPNSSFKQGEIFISFHRLAPHTTHYTQLLSTTMEETGEQCTVVFA